MPFNGNDHHNIDRFFNFKRIEKNIIIINEASIIDTYCLLDDSIRFRTDVR